MKEICRVVAVVLAAAVFADSFALAGTSRALVSLCLFTVPAVLAGLTLVSERLITLAALALVGQYVAGLYAGHHRADVFVPLVAAAVLLFVEVADLAISVPSGTRLDRSVVRGRLLAAAASVTLAVAVSAATLALSQVVSTSSTVIRVLGLAGAALAVVAPMMLLRAAPDDGDAGPGARRRH